MISRAKTMADRFLSNDMPNFVPETDDPSAAGAVVSSSSLLKLLSLPYSKTAERFLRAALDLKEKVVKETWVRAGCRVKDFSLYTGALGTAFLLLKSYLVTGDRRDLTLCNEIVRACDSASQGSKYVMFICGRAGVCALGAVAAKHTGDEALLNHYLKAFQEAFTCFLLDKANQLIAEGKMHSGDRPYSLFEGQAGMAYLFLNMVKPSESLFPAYEL